MELTKMMRGVRQDSGSSTADSSRKTKPFQRPRGRPRLLVEQECQNERAAFAMPDVRLLGVGLVIECRAWGKRFPRDRPWPARSPRPPRAAASPPASNPPGPIPPKRWKSAALCAACAAPELGCLVVAAEAAPDRAGALGAGAVGLGGSSRAVDVGRRDKRLESDAERGRPPRPLRTLGLRFRLRRRAMPRPSRAARELLRARNPWSASARLRRHGSRDRKSAEPRRTSASSSDCRRTDLTPAFDAGTSWS